MSHTRRKYDPEFRAGAVRIVRETRRPVVEIARSLRLRLGCEDMATIISSYRTQPRPERDFLTRDN